MTLTKNDLVEGLMSECGLEKVAAKRFVDGFFEEISESLAQGEEVKLSGFGHFHLLDKAPRPGRNPKTGEEVLIKARRVVSFKAAQKLRDQVENIKPEA